MEELTDIELKYQLHYNPTTGDFRRLVSNCYSVKIGDIAGTMRKDGYIQITVNGKPYLAHRLAWLYIHGYFPENEIDHVDRVRHHNWIMNLREASRQCQSRNCHTSKNNKSGVVGVFWHKQRGKWLSSIMENNKTIHLGRFTSKTDAVKARWNAEVEYGFPNCNTISTAYLYLRENGIL